MAAVGVGLPELHLVGYEVVQRPVLRDQVGLVLEAPAGLLVGGREIAGILEQLALAAAERLQASGRRARQEVPRRRLRAAVEDASAQPDLAPLLAPVERCRAPRGGGDLLALAAGAARGELPATVVEPLEQEDPRVGPVRAKASCSR